jgi:hypothetical protein
MCACVFQQTEVLVNEHMKVKDVEGSVMSARTTRRGFT